MSETRIRERNILPTLGNPETKKVQERPEGYLFQNTLEGMDDDKQKQKLIAMYNSIVEQGKKFSEKIDIKELQHYKKMVSEFLYDAVNYTHKFNKENSFDRRGRHKIYGIINNINQSVEELTQEVLKTEKNNLKILQKLDDIRGMLLDIFM